MRMITLYTPKIITKSIMRINIQPDISLFAHFKHKGKYMVTVRISQLSSKNLYFFSLMHIKISGKNINFDNKKNQKGDF